MSYRNGFFQLVDKGNSTYIKVFPAQDGGESVSVDEIKNYLERNRITNYDLSALNGKLNNITTATEYKISDYATWPIHESCLVKIQSDMLIATARFYPPSTKGGQMQKQDIIDELHRCGVVHGIVDESIDLFLQKRMYCVDICIAEATLPVEGKDASIQYFFNLNVSSRPTMNEDGTVDFHHLDNINKVEKDVLLARLTPADHGVIGRDVKGNKIFPKKVKNLILRKTKQTYLSEDELSLYSAVSGHVSLVDGKVFVSDTYEVPADVNTSTGDIEYDGNVVVRGNVRTGYSVKAKGNVIVEGVVEGANIVADGDIILKGGIQGMNRGSLEAKGNIVTKFIENSTVKAGGSIQAEAVLHSTVIAKDDILVGGKRGLVTGGEMKAGAMITLKVAGSTMGTATVIEVGIDPSIMERYHYIEQRITQIAEEKNKLQQVYQLYKQKILQGMKLPLDKVALIKSIPKNMQNLEMESEDLQKEHEDLREDMEGFNNGNIVVENMIYPGTKIVIGNTVYYVRKEEHHCKFIKDQGEVKSVFL